MAEYEHIIVEQGDGVGVVRLNRPKVLNAISVPLMTEVARCAGGDWTPTMTSAASS